MPGFYSFIIIIFYVILHVKVTRLDWQGVRAPVRYRAGRGSALWPRAHKQENPAQALCQQVGLGIPRQVSKERQSFSDPFLSVNPIFFENFFKGTFLKSFFFHLALLYFLAFLRVTCTNQKDSVLLLMYGTSMVS